MTPKSPRVDLGEGEIVRLNQWIRAGSTPQQVATRARIILAAHGGETNQQIARQLKGQRRTSALWRRRVLARGIGCIWEMEPGRGRKTHDGVKASAQIVEATLGQQAVGFHALEHAHPGSSPKVQ